MKTVTGDLIKLAEEGHFDFIVHGCNCFCAMGAGIARQLADKYPQVLEADKCTVAGAKEKLGYWTESDIECDLHKFTVINAYTQYRPSTASDVFEYDKFKEFLERFLMYVKKCSDKSNEQLSVGFPMIGAGLAGGDWNRILSMIEEFSRGVKEYADVTIVKFG